MATVMTVVLALLHAGFMVLETFLWDQPAGRKIFRHSKEDAAKTKILAANQGVYNGALAALLIWSAFRGDIQTMAALQSFVLVVGIYGGITAAPAIFMVQAAPAAVALLFTVVF